MSDLFNVNLSKIIGLAPQIELQNADLDIIGHHIENQYPHWFLQSRDRSMQVIAFECILGAQYALATTHFARGFVFCAFDRVRRCLKSVGFSRYWTGGVCYLRSTRCGSNSPHSSISY
jgi:hypothetical protein